jgi:hypothetical protein
MIHPAISPVDDIERRRQRKKLQSGKLNVELGLCAPIGYPRNGLTVSGLGHEYYTVCVTQYGTRGLERAKREKISQGAS